MPSSFEHCWVSTEFNIVKCFTSPQSFSSSVTILPKTFVLLEIRSSPYNFHLSFRDFLGLASGDKVPYARTIRTFKEGLTRKGVFDQLFACFYQFLKNNNPLKDVDVNDAKAFLIFSSEDWDERLKVMPVQRVLICKDTEVLRQLKDNFSFEISGRDMATVEGVFLSLPLSSNYIHLPPSNTQLLYKHTSQVPWGKRRKGINAVLMVLYRQFIQNCPINLIRVPYGVVWVITIRAIGI